MPGRSRSRSSGRLTLKDVARAAGVSTATVSNAYARPDQLSGDLRRRVLRIAEDLGYPGPDPLARHLSIGRTGTVAFVFSEDMPYAFSDSAVLALLRGVATECERKGISLMLLPVRAKAGPAAPRQPVMDVLASAAVDGLILYALSGYDDVVTAASRRQVPLVIIDQPRRTDIPVVRIDDFAAARDMARHVVRAGHRSVGIVSLRTRRDGYSGFMDPERRATIGESTAAQRLRGFYAAFDEAGIGPDTIPVWESWENTEHNGEQAARDMLARKKTRPTAILAMSDRLALGVMADAARRKLRIPHDLSVTGFDDIPQAAATGLTTIRQPFTEKGAAALRTLFDTTGRSTTLATELVQRTSLAHPQFR
ncbi:LacI family DNA-binding transcriptional regulator [Nguyenibacter vanlangensis]|uniref:LacI family DNA-binding transcriptional regulator n=1 Tax=Nguyenibacter vanlangensis TaxID=1216886 RepID=A0ABZ3D1C9_9PROT